MPHASVGLPLDFANVNAELIDCAGVFVNCR